MDSVTFIAVVLSALSHAGWNFFAKKSTAPQDALIALGMLLIGLVGLPVLGLLSIQMPHFSSGLWTAILISSALHATYGLFLGLAYRSGTLSFVYPIARGSGIALLAVWESLVASGSLTVGGIVAIAAIVLGGLFLSRGSLTSGSALALSLGVGTMSASFSWVDSQAMSTLSPAFYILAINLGSGLMGCLGQGLIARRNFIQVLRFHKREAFAISFAGAATYLVILWAFARVDTVSYVVALRELSIAFAFLIGVLALKEAATLIRWFGASLVTGGAVAIRFLSA